MPHGRKWQLLGVAIVVIGGITLWWGWPQLTTPTEVRAGQRLYTIYCAACHGAAGQGPTMEIMRAQVEAGLISPPPHDRTGHTWQHSDDEIIKVALQGTTQMPRIGNPPTEAEARVILAYIKTLWTPEQRKNQAGTLHAMP